MAAITICVPAYGAAPFIGQTLDAVRAQTFRDYVVDIAVEPPGADETELACRPYLEDTRFRLHRNADTLGYAGNVRALLARVESPYFMVLPHDDLLDPHYLDVLVSAIGSRPDAVVAFSDAFVFGDGTGRQFADIPDGALGARLLGFFLDGANGEAWRGVTRYEALTHPFPSNDFADFAVEVEWALRLIREGVALRVARPLYFKRALRATNLSWAWVSSMPEARLRDALEHHRHRLLEGIPDSGISAGQRRAIVLAAEGAALRRWVLATRGRFELGTVQIERADRVLAECGDRGLAAREEIAAQVLVALARYWRLRGDLAQSERLATSAVASDPRRWEGWFELAAGRLLRGDVDTAVGALQTASELAPQAVGLLELGGDLARRMSERHPWTGDSLHAGAQNKAPTNGVDGDWYLAEYPDVRAAGMNPLVHYLRHGRAEGRRPRP